MQAKDIPDVVMLREVEKASVVGRITVPAISWELAERMGLPLKLVTAKLKQLEKRDLVDGCTCGSCRGDWTLSPKGRELLAKEKTGGDVGV